MRDKSQRILVVMIVLSILALMVTGLGIAWLQAVLRQAGNQQNASLQSPPVVGATHVFIRNDTYQPAAIEGVWGAAITWTNADTAVHSVVLPHIIDSETGIRESDPLSQGQSFTYTFLARGTFQYYCAEHPGIVGVVIVT